MIPIPQVLKIPSITGYFSQVANPSSLHIQETDLSDPSISLATFDFPTLFDINNNITLLKKCVKTGIELFIQLKLSSFLK